jgi:hypothetical protein
MRISLVLLLTATLATAAAAQSKSRVYTGVISESMCGSSHTSMGMGPDPKCIVECVRVDKTVKYVLLDGRTSYILSDQQTPERFAAKRVKVTGVHYAKTNILKVEKIEAVD